MRGFFLLELIIALSVAAMVMSATALLAFTAPRTVSSAQREIAMIDQLNQIFRASATQTMSDFSRLVPIASSTENGTVSLSYLPREDEHSRLVRATASWVSGFGIRQNASLQTVMRDPEAAPEACDPFVSGDWTQIERSATYRVTPAEVSSSAMPYGGYALSDIAGTPWGLVLAASASDAQAPTLLFLSADREHSLAYAGGFDNAARSRIGFDALAVSGSTVFAANAFGSASTSTCADGISCAQVQVFAYDGTAPPVRLSSLSLATSSPPYAIELDGASAPTTALAFSDGFLYLGLQKTAHGDEFNIIDARDPARLVWRSGYRIGRSVRSITVRGRYAYVSTADPARELMVFAIQDPDTPTVVGIFDAPGSTAFGYGAESTAFPGRLRFGRTYSSNAPELELLYVSGGEADSGGNGMLEITEAASADIGTPRDPESMRDLLTQDWLTFALLTHRLTLWDTSRLTAYGVPYELPAGSTGVALTCRNNLLYLARNDASGAGFIDLLRGAPSSPASP